MIRRKNVLNEDSETNNGENISNETIISFVTTIKNMVSDMLKKTLSNENIEKYKDMRVTKINTIYVDGDSSGEVDHYTYDVEDSKTGDYYNGLISISPDTYAVGDIVRVYISNIEYIGFKITI